MAHDVDLDPERLRPLARRASALLDGLAPPPALDAASRDRLARDPAGAALLAEVDALTGSVGRAAREIAELAARLAGASGPVEQADADTAAGLRRIAEGM